MDDLASLVAHAQAGDTAAYGTLVSRFQDMAYGYAYAILGDFDLAQDAAQEAFVEAYRCLSSLREPQAFPGWFKRIVFKHCDRLTRGKLNALKTPIDTDFGLAADVPGPVEVVERQETQALVLQAVQALPNHERQVTALYYINGYSQNEIADFLEVPATTVKSRLHASRKRLKERMLAMVQDALKSNALPENFTEETLAQAVAQAAGLNKQHEYGQAEDLLRAVLGKAPDHSGALKELNRTLMWGHVWGQGHWDRLSELAQNGRRLIESGSADEAVYHDMALTLLAVPAMPEAVRFIEGWIEKQGPGLERLGMLAWAKGCVAEYERAEALWNEFLILAADVQDVKSLVFQLSTVCLALVDCFVAAGESDRAVRVAQSGWALYADVAGALRGQYQNGEENWPLLFHKAGLPLDEVVRYQIEKLEPIAQDDLLRQGAMLMIRAWIDDAEPLIADWLAWVQICAQADSLTTLHYLHGRATMALRQTGRPDVLNAWAGAIRQWLKTAPDKDAPQLVDEMTWAEYNGWAYLEAGDLDGAEQIARQAIEEAGSMAVRHFADGAHPGARQRAKDKGYVVAGCFLVEVAIRRGKPTPPDVIRFIEGNGIEAIDEYGMTGWYVIAREAAAAGDLDKAFAALERAINYWSNPPLVFDEYWEHDAYWGDLREHPEYRRIYREKRERIGPIYGELHYFPGW
ncbi:MAG: sigma-70 family RNA polymerase sigma factor [Anaerolineae bacterium]|nr:sigma-70 family RNA polymerase sigma factor [Anaerolineae bacterium]